MDYSLVVGVDDETHELVVGIVGRFLPAFMAECTHEGMFHRLYPHLHMGQEARELGERVRIPWWRWQGRAHDSRAEAVQATFYQCDGKVLSLGEFAMSCLCFMPC